MSYRQRITSSDQSRYSPNDHIHDSRKGYGTVSKTGKTILWHDWRPPTKEEIRTYQERAAWLKTPEGQEYCKRTDKVFDSFLAKNNTFREEISRTILKVIEDAPPFSSLFSDAGSQF